MSFISQFIEQKDALTFSFENQYLRFSYISILPIQANTSSGKDETTGKETSWCQLTAQYKVAYDRVDEKGEVYEDDNATVKTIFIKFGYDYMKKYNITGSELIKFFRENFVGKRFLTLPVGEETPVFEFKNNARNIVKNQSQVRIDDEFDISAFIKSFTTSSKVAK